MSSLVDNILQQLDFHPLSVTLLATVAHNNRWDNGRLTREWAQYRTGVLQTEHNRSLAATIELSLASPMFRELGPEARGLLGVVAFFPQGINENNIDWLFPTKNIFSWLSPAIPKRTDIFDKFCVLSLTYRCEGFITMLAPLRDYLGPKDPASSPLLLATKKRYFSRLSVHIDPDKPSFKAARWITSEDVNVEHLLDVFTTTDARSSDTWRACRHFMQHLRWHKPRLVMLGPKIERLSDKHRTKPQCLVELSELFSSVGNDVQRKKLLVHTLKLWRERADHAHVAETLQFLAEANRCLGLHEEGIKQAKEAVEIFKRRNNRLGQGQSNQRLAQLLYDDQQLEAAEEATSLAINLLSNNGDQLPLKHRRSITVCRCYRLLGNICYSKGEMGKAISHFKTALEIASSFDWHNEHFWIHHSLAKLFFGNNGFDDAHAHVECAKSHTINNAYNLGRAMELQAQFWHEERKFEEAKSEALHAVDVYEKVGAIKDVERCRVLLRDIEMAVGGSIICD